MAISKNPIQIQVFTGRPYITWPLYSNMFDSRIILMFSWCSFFFQNGFLLFPAGRRTVCHPRVWKDMEGWFMRKMEFMWNFALTLPSPYAWQILEMASIPFKNWIIAIAILYYVYIYIYIIYTYIYIIIYTYIYIYQGYQTGAVVGPLSQKTQWDSLFF